MTMLHAAVLAAVLGSTPVAPPVSVKTPIQQCFAAMDGAVYHGDPSDRTLMKANVAACASGLATLGRMRAATSQGPEKLFLTARLLDRAATLSYMGLGDAGTALREVKLANLYFRIAAGLRNQSDDYHAAALGNAELTAVQLQTLHTEVAAARTTLSTAVALRTRGANDVRPSAPARVSPAAYHKL